MPVVIKMLIRANRPALGYRFLVLCQAAASIAVTSTARTAKGPHSAGMPLSSATSNLTVASVADPWGSVTRSRTSAGAWEWGLPSDSSNLVR